MPRRLYEAVCSSLARISVMKSKCDKCDRPATHHSVEIVNKQKIEKHFCDIHAAEEGMAVKSVGGAAQQHTPLNELLTNFVKLHSGAPESVDEVTCENCGLTFPEFRESSLMGCPSCYSSFEQPLEPLLERAHGTGTHHVGKVPRRGGASEVRQQQLLRMRRRLDEAVDSEDYELAARLRDELRRVEGGEE